MVWWNIYPNTQDRKRRRHPNIFNHRAPRCNQIPVRLISSSSLYGYHPSSKQSSIWLSWVYRQLHTPDTSHRRECYWWVTKILKTPKIRKKSRKKEPNLKPSDYLWSSRIFNPHAVASNEPSRASARRILPQTNNVGGSSDNFHLSPMFCPKSHIRMKGCTLGFTGFLTNKGIVAVSIDHTVYRTASQTSSKIILGEYYISRLG